MAKPTIAEVLHYAADHCLWHPQKIGNTSIPSCFAIYDACRALKASKKLKDAIFIGLQNMGLATDSYDFQSFLWLDKKQEARYAWLKFAALIAEEQGV